MNGHLVVSGLRASHPGKARALDGIDLHATPGQLVVVVGPSGCGKTTLLRTIAGLHPASAGTIEVDERVIDGWPAEDRPITMVFQSDTLFPELTVGENVSFGLRVRGIRADESSERVRVALLRLGLAGLEAKYPDELSGGQSRRVAIARSLVVHPSVLLLDEPLAGLDQKLSRRIMGQIRAAQLRMGLTTLLVIHDQELALSVADLLIVLDQGRVAQVGPPRDVYERPDSVFVAEFLGRSTFMDAEVLTVTNSGQQRLALVDVLGQTHTVPAHPAVTPREAATLVLRPHAVRVVPRPLVDADLFGDEGIVQETYYYGDRIEYLVETANGNVVGTGNLTDPLLEAGSVVRLLLDVEHAWVLPLR